MKSRLPPMEDSRTDAVAIGVQVLCGCHSCGRRIYDGTGTVPGVAAIPCDGVSGRVAVCPECHKKWVASQIAKLGLGH